jgi:hypothetical protein
MILGDEGPGGVPGPRRRTSDGESRAVPEAGVLRQMALHLETAALLEARALRAEDPAQQVVLRHRAQQRRREAARLRARLAERGLALGG